MPDVEEKTLNPMNPRKKRETNRCRAAFFAADGTQKLRRRQAQRSAQRHARREEARLRSEVNSELNFPPNFEGLVLGCIDADFCK